jgi:hypothetical protein
VTRQDNDDMQEENKIREDIEIPHDTDEKRKTPC